MQALLRAACGDHDGTPMLENVAAQGRADMTPSEWHPHSEQTTKGNGKMPSPLYPIIKNRLADALEREKGLTIVAAPTGGGKTHATAETMAERIALDQGKERHIFLYLTPTKVNRDEFYGKIAGQLPDGHAARRVVSVESVLDSVSRAIDLTDQGKIDVPPFVTGSPEYRRLKSYLSYWRRSEDKTNGTFDARQYERAFRNWVKTSIAGRIRDINEENKKAEQIGARQYMEGEGRADWKWIERFWPMSRPFSDYDVLIMTPQMFLSPIDTVLDGFLDLTSESFLENVSGIVIDESDYVNDVMLDKLCGDAAERDYDPLILLSKIHRLMGGAQTIEEWFSPRFLKFARYGQGWQSTARRLNEIMAQIRTVYRKYHLDCNLVMDDDSRKKLGDGFMFTYESTSMSGRKAYVAYDGAGQNILGIPGPGRHAAEEGIRLDWLVHDCQAALHSLSAYLNYASRAYEDGKNKLIKATHDAASTEGENPVDGGMALSTVLHDLHIEEYKPIRQMIAMFKNNTADNRKGHGDRIGDMSVHSNGISLARVLRNTSHDSYVGVRLTELNETPAGILCRCAGKTNVLLVSATAGVDSMKNFPVTGTGYVRASLGGDFMEEDETERAAIMKAAEKANGRLRSLYRIDTPTIRGIDMETAMEMEPDVFWRTVFDDPENILAACGDGRVKDPFVKVRVRNRLAAFGKFLDSDSDAGLMFVASLNADEMGATLSLMERLAGERKPDDTDYRNCARVLKADSWNDGFPKVQEDSERKPVFIITAYQTAGQGKDILLRKKERMDGYVHVPGGNEAYRDVDFTYLEKPTHILTINGSLRGDPKQQLKSIVEVRELKEEGEISSRECRHYTNLLVGEGSEVVPYAKLPSVRAWMSRIVYQAIGRTTRSAWRKRNVTITLDPELIDAADADAFANVPLTYEAEELFNSMHWNATAMPSRRDRVLERIQNQSVCVGFHCQRIASNREWATDERIRSNWRNVREELLQHPTWDSRELFATRMPNLAKYIYARVPAGTRAIHYRTRKDYKGETKASFVPFPEPIPAGERDEWTQSTVSEENSGLPILMRNRTVMEYFDRHGYAGRWNDGNDSWMVPAAFNNIYKGALGEAAGTAIIEELYGRLDTLDDCPDAFEQFDAYLPPTAEGRQGVMFDFKHWNGYDKTGPEADRYLELIAEKLAMVERVRPTGLVVIVNSLSTGRGEPRFHGPRVLTVPGLVQPDGRLHERNIRILRAAIDDTEKER